MYFFYRIKPHCLPLRLKVSIVSSRSLLAFQSRRKKYHCKNIAITDGHTVLNQPTIFIKFSDRIFFKVFIFTDPIFVTTNRGAGKVLQIGQNRYLKDYCDSRGSKTRWRCYKKNFGCKAYLFTVDDYVVKTGGTHNHTNE